MDPDDFDYRSGVRVVLSGGVVLIRSQSGDIDDEVSAVISLSPARAWRLGVTLIQYSWRAAANVRRGADPNNPIRKDELT